MFYSLLLIALIIAAIWFQRRFSRFDEQQRKRWLKQYGLWFLLAVVLVLVASGRAHWLMGVLAALLAVMGRLTQLLSYFPLFKKLFDSANASAGQNQQSGQSPKTGKMTAEQAREILGLDEGCTQQEVIDAHRRLMQKLHPDRGGTDALAAQINEAKQVLLKNY